jgi:DNA mismatch endonuclease (patch repair protein)
MLRDKSKAQLLRGMGFKVLTIWECETQNRSRLTRRLSKLAVPR